MADPVAQAQTNLMNVDVNNENTALNVLVGFLTVAQRRGAFTLEEASKVFECIKVFQQGKNTDQTSVMSKN